MGAIGLKVSVDVLCIFAIEGVLEGDAPNPVLIVVIDIHDRYFVPSLLEVGLGELDEVVSGIRGYFH